MFRQFFSKKAAFSGLYQANVETFTFFMLLPMYVPNGMRNMNTVLRCYIKIF